MHYDAPPSEFVYQIPADQFAVSGEQPVKKKEEIAVQPFGIADKNLGQTTPNTRIHFYDHYKEVKNASIVDMQWMGYNYSSLCFRIRGRSSVTVAFDLKKEHLTSELGLYLTHLSSDLHEGTYDSAITILINGQVYCNKYVPQSHDWIWDDEFDLSDFVRSGVLHEGINTVKIVLHPHSWSNYWLHSIKIKH